MGEQIKIKAEQLNNDLSSLKSAIDDFQPYSKNFISQTREIFDEFNSDFFSKMDSVIKNLSDKVAKDILEDVQKIYDQTSEVVKSFQEYDANLAKKMK